MSELKKWCEAHASGYSGSIFYDEPMARHTYYRIGGAADVFLSPSSLEDLDWVAQALRETNTPYYVLGAGSNVLFSDSGFRGLVLQTSKMNSVFELIHQPEPPALLLRTGASVSVPSVIRRAMQEGWRGLEFLCGIPGTLGGAVYMNAGTQLGEVKDHAVKVAAIPLRGPNAGKLITFQGDTLRFEYRKNLFLPEDAVIWSVDWAISSGPVEEIKKILTETLERRKETQPLNFPSCGSVFKNPSPCPMKTWQIVTHLGLQGHRQGNAQISVKHSNFIVNLGGAQAAEVKALIDLIQRRAKAEMGIDLELEVQLIGKF